MTLASPGPAFVRLAIKVTYRRVDVALAIAVRGIPLGRFLNGLARSFDSYL
jgi:hypothetical protein